MYEPINTTAHLTNPPAILNTLTEIPRAIFEAGSLMTLLPSLSLLSSGDKHPVLLIPGFMAGDRSLGLLKRYLGYMGYQPETWGVGHNTGSPDHLFDHLPEKLDQLFEKYGEPISIIGQSLGGVFARELGRDYPEKVRQIITLGSPLAAKNSAVTMRALRHLLKASAGHSIEEMVDMMRARKFHMSPDLPLTAVFSKGDGVVHWASCQEETEDHHTQNIEVPGSHCGMAFNPMIYYIIMNRLNQQIDAWQKFRWQDCPLSIGRA